MNDADDPSPPGANAAARLFPLVYDELRYLAAHKLVGEAPGQTLDATGLVHEAYLRLIDRTSWDNRGHFFSAASSSSASAASSPANAAADGSLSPGDATGPGLKRGK
jgi:hypothetical protein